MINPPPSEMIYNFSGVKIWFDDSGILYVTTKRVPRQPTPHQAKEGLVGLKAIIEKEKVCIMIDISNCINITKWLRDLAAEELPAFSKALAIYSDSLMGRIHAKLFLELKPHPYPIKLFSSEAEALKWLRQFSHVHYEAR